MHVTTHINKFYGQENKIEKSSPSDAVGVMP